MAVTIDVTVTDPAVKAVEWDGAETGSKWNTSRDPQTGALRLFYTARGETVQRQLQGFDGDALTDLIAIIEVS